MRGETAVTGKRKMRAPTKLKRELGRLFIVILTAFSLLVLVALGYSLVEMQWASTKTTTNYVLNLTQQLTNMVDLEISCGRQQLISIGDSFEQVVSKEDDAGVQEFLDRKHALCGFDFIILEDTKSDRTIVAGSFPSIYSNGISDLQAMETSRLAQESGVCKMGIEDENIVYAMPLYDDSGQIGFLWAGNTPESMQDIIRSRSFQGRTYSCIINKAGDLLLTSDQRDKFQNLAFVFENAADAELLKNMDRMKADLESGQSGIFPFVSAEGDDVYLAYTPMYGDSRVMLTMVPTDLLSTEYNDFVYLAAAAVLGTLLVFMSFFVLLIRSHRTTRRELEHLAYFDEVTGGGNNQDFCMKCRQLHRQTDVRQFALVLIDVINFKEVNKKFGVEQGNAVLRYLYTVISGALDTEKNEFAARSEMDHFFLCLREQEPGAVQRRLDDITEQVASFEGPRLPGYHLSFRTAACFVEDANADPVVLEDRVRAVLKSPDAVPGKCVFYSPGFEERLRKEQELDSDFESALPSGEFLLYFQPKVSLSEGRVTGAEALVRWQHPQRGLVPPNDFIPLLERTGKILRLDKYVFEQVCLWIRERQNSGKALFPVSVNLSRSHLMNEGFLSWFVETADRYGIPHDLLEFELTESTFMHQDQIRQMQAYITQMHELGFRMSIDDFGTGFSSISLLREFDVDVLKLDRTFFLDLDDRKAREVVRCLVELAKKLRIRVVAEGIETKKQLDFLSSLGCDVIQGYFFSKPLPEPAFNEWYGGFDFARYGA